MQLYECLSYRQDISVHSSVLTRTPTEPFGLLSHAKNMRFQRLLRKEMNSDMLPVPW